MEHCRAWFERSAPTGEHSLSLLTRAGIAHLYRLDYFAHTVLDGLLDPVV